MRKIFYSFTIAFAILSVSVTVAANKTTVLSDADKKIVQKFLDEWDSQYDAAEKMLTETITGWQYHMDAASGTVHGTRASFYYADALFDVGGKENTQRALDIIDRVIDLQDTVATSLSRGVFPYFLEEPLATKKSPIDYNWADFNGALLLDIYITHRDEIPVNIRAKMKDAIILTADAIKRRNVAPDYTNIALMGTYVTYMSSVLFDLPDMHDYALKKLDVFYNYTLAKKGFSEYNSPTYTITALTELERMKRHFPDSDVKVKIDSLYSIGWDVIARHYHASSAQWTGPNSRSYSSFVHPSFYGLLNNASNGKIDLGYTFEQSDMKVKHRIPDYLLGYFIQPHYPRTEVDTFENNPPQVIGTSYMADAYAISTANRSSLWNQRRPLLAYWGSKETPCYMQLRFLHDFYDFSSAMFYGVQRENSVLACINLETNGCDKHIWLSPIKDGKVDATDFRLRFEFGNCPDMSAVELPENANAPFEFELNGLQFHIRLFISQFDSMKGHWEKGGDEKTGWIDFVIYAGDNRQFDLNALKSAVWGLSLKVGDKLKKQDKTHPKFGIKNGTLNVKENGLKISVPVKPHKRESNI